MEIRSHWGEMVVGAMSEDKIPNLAKTPGLSCSVYCHLKSWKEKPKEQRPRGRAKK